MRIGLGRMYFGKHKGEKFKDVPISYMIWVYDNVEDLRIDLLKFLEKNIQMFRHIDMYHKNDYDYNDFSWGDGFSN